MKPHGLMFHHFHDKELHIECQGSMSAEDFSLLLDYYELDHNIISADEFAKRLKKDTLKAGDVCLTFDDGLLSQFDVAEPVLKRRGIRAFWFIYSAPLDGLCSNLEIYHDFRFRYFHDIDDFYNAFFDRICANDNRIIDLLRNLDPAELFVSDQFFTDNDRRFRYIRDEVLGEARYYQTMDEMLKDYGYDIEQNSKYLWMTGDHIRSLHKDGHIIGLHSYSHPTMMSKKKFEDQLEEYDRNMSQLEEIISDKVFTCSYPCNSYNLDTLKCMSQLGITVGFRDNMDDIRPLEPALELPRENHSNVLRKMRNSLV